jgi:hypothetical protein
LLAFILRPRVWITVRSRRPCLLGRFVIVGHRAPGSLVDRRGPTSGD